MRAEMQESVKFVAELNSSPVLKALASYFVRTRAKCPNPNCANGIIKGTQVGCCICSDSHEMPGPRTVIYDSDFSTSYKTSLTDKSLALRS